MVSSRLDGDRKRLEEYLMLPSQNFGTRVQASSTPNILNSLTLQDLSSKVPIGGLSVPAKGGGRLSRFSTKVQSFN
jgi:hypothetical protein